MGHTTTKPAKAKKSPESYHITDWDALYELKEQNKSGRETVGPLRFRKSVVISYDDVSHDYRTRVKRMKVHSERHVLRSVYDDLVDMAAQYDRKRRGWLVDTDDQPLSLSNLAIELELWDEQRRPDEKLLEDILSKLELLGLLEKCVYKPRKRNRPKKSNDDESETRENQSVHKGCENKELECRSLSDNVRQEPTRVGSCRQPSRTTTETEHNKTKLNGNDNETEIEVSTRAGPARNLSEWKTQKLQELEQRKQTEPSQTAVDASLSSPPTPPSVDAGEARAGIAGSGPPLLSLDDIAACARSAELPEHGHPDHDPVCQDYAWRVFEALGLGHRSDPPPASKRDRDHRSRELGNYRAALQDAMATVPPGELSRLCAEGLKLARRIQKDRDRYHNPGKSWRGLWNIISQGKARKAG